MKAILLAGGRGTRISKYIGERPKCTLDIGGISLIANTVKLLKSNHIDVSVVVGYNKDMVIEALDGFHVKYFYNPFYNVTNSIASLWFAREELVGDDIIVANADVYWEQEIVNIILSDQQDQVLLMDSSRHADYLFKCKENKLIDYGKSLKEYSGEYVGIAKISEGFLKLFKNRLDKLIDNGEYHLWWENVLYSFIQELDINVIDIKGVFWSEIDIMEDYKRIIRYRAKKYRFRNYPEHFMGRKNHEVYFEY